MLIEISNISPVDPPLPDDFLILAASWEERSLGILSRLGTYAARKILLIAYDNLNPKREQNIKIMQSILSEHGDMRILRASQRNPLQNIREVIRVIRNECSGATPRISLDVTSFTKKHLLQLLNGLEQDNFTRHINLYHAEPLDFPTHDIQPLSHGISSVQAIETFTGSHLPSRDEILVLFLGFEGARALALWQHLEPNTTFVVIPDPPYKPSWSGRTEKQNQFLLSCIPDSNLLRSHSLEPASSEKLLQEIILGSASHAKYNYLLAPLGTKAQAIGLYRFWRRNRGVCTLMYASPVGYSYDQPSYPADKMWLIDKSEEWDR